MHMATYSVGLTKNVHRDLQYIKRNYNVTMIGFAVFALKSILKSKTQIEKILNKMEEEQVPPSYGASRLQDLGY